MGTQHGCSMKFWKLSGKKGFYCSVLSILGHLYIIMSVINLFCYSMHLLSLTPVSEPISCHQPLADIQSLFLWSTQASARNKFFQEASWASLWWCRSMFHVVPHGEFGGDGVVRLCGTPGGTLPMLANQNKCGTTCESVIYTKALENSLAIISRQTSADY